jgi:hypothetical protein
VKLILTVFGIAILLVLVWTVFWIAGTKPKS